MTADALRALPRLLLRTGYVDAYGVFGTLHLRRPDVDARRALVAPAQMAMLDLWLLERRVPRADVLQAMSAAELDALLAAGIVGADGEAIVNELGVVLPMFGQILVIPSLDRGDAVYFGPDSCALATRIAPPVRGRVLDLCTGTGVTALRAAANGAAVVAVDLEPAAVAWARRNAVINSVEDRVDVRCGDLWAAVDGEPFDLVIANPPTAFVPDGLQFPARYAGGPDGTAIARRVLERLPTALAPGGVAQLVSASLGGDDAPALASYLDALARTHGLRIVMTVVTRVPLARGNRTFERLARAYAEDNDLAVDRVVRALDAHLARLGATSLYRFFLAISRGAPHGLVVSRYDRAGGPGFFL